MATTLDSKPCQANDNGTTCEKDARAKCFHCSRDLCLMHLTEHTQLVENQTRSSLHSHEKLLNDLSNKLKTISISSRISESPFVQLEKWRREAHQKLDQLAEQKRQEIQQSISEYQKEFTRRTNEQKQKLDLLKKRLNDLSRQTQIANKDLKYFDEKIFETKTFLSSIERHSIKISTYAFCVNIRTNFFDSSSSSTPPTSPTPVQPRRTRPEMKESASNGTRHRFDKKRSLSVSLL